MDTQHSQTPKERVFASLEHREPDRVPLFYRSIPEVDERLKRDLDLPDDEALLRHLDIDFRWVEPRYVGPSLEIEGKPNRKRNIWGVEYEHVKAETGSYWGAANEPLKDVTAPAALDDYPWPQLDWFDFSGLRTDCERYSEFAVMTAGGSASPGIMSPIQDMIGMERVFMDPMLNREFFKKLIEIGVDVVDPLQVLAKGMDPAKLKQQFGDHVTFSGGIDEQELLPSGTPEDVRAEVVRMCDLMAPGGGYFVGSTHNFQEDVPTENIVAMYEAAREWRYDDHQSN